MWLGIIILSLIILILIYFIWSKRECSVIFAKISSADLESNAKQLAIAMRMPDAVGSSPKIGQLKAKLLSTYRVVAQKVNKGEELYEFEKWLYENYYTIAQLVNKKVYRNFALLPHKNKQTRILAIAELIVNASYGEVTTGVIDTIISTFNTHTPLHIEEIRALKDAIIYALFAKLADISSKVKHYDRMKKFAKDSVIHEKYTSSDCYLYWLSRFGKSVDNKSLVKNADINLDNIEYSFTTTLIDNCIIVSNCIKSLKKIKDIFVGAAEIKYTYANTLMRADKVYCDMDNDSKILYLSAVDKLASKFNVSEKSIIDSAFALALAHGEHFGKYLFENKILIKAYLFSKKTKKVKIKNTRKLQGLYIAVVFTANTIVATLLGLLSGSVIFGIIIGILSGIAALQLVEYLVQKAHKSIVTKRPTPRLEWSNVPVESRTMVVVPCYVASLEQIKEICDNIKALRAVNHDKNISYALLLDYKRADKAIISEDFTWNNAFATELSTQSDINCFVRRRTLINKKYSGFERKRGAISALNDLLLTNNYYEFSYIFDKNILKPEFICVLDADSKLMPHSLVSAIATLAHPLNQEYDIMTFANVYNMNSIDSIYSKQFYYNSGYEGYNNYSNYYFDAFNRAIFCGKGIYRLGSFYNKLNGALPNGKILSHDIIEGAILNCGALSEAVYEDAPKNFISENIRDNRWLAGDIQLVSMMKSKIKNADGKKKKVDKDPIYNYVIFTNFLKGLMPIATLALVLIALFTMNLGYSLAAIALLGGKLLVGILERIAGINKGIRLKYILLGIIQAISAAVIDFLILPFRASNNLFVYLKSLYVALFDKSRELKWKTFFESQYGYCVSSYAMMLTPSFVLMTIIGMLGYNNMLILGYIAIYFATIICLYPLGIQTRHVNNLDESERSLLLMYARKTYNYFDLNRNENALICDNYQVKPYKGGSIGTSPTNIGFSLLAEVAACELGIIESSRASENIYKILKNVMSLKKYKGHLYNWYNIENKAILPPNYISSVDSGNLVACLIATKEFLNKNKLNGADICERIIYAMDFDFLFDSEKGLFHIGYNTQSREFGGYYDLLASEAQILNYIMSARSRDANSWRNLSRIYAKTNGNTLLSWSGTMFEYLMPTIFFQAPRGSLLDSTAKSIIKTQRSHKCNGLFGISESGYYKFDENLNYQYHAFGESSLALRAESNRCVISPYSSFLAMNYDTDHTLDNLYKLYENDAFGEYGFFEAIDFTSGKNIVNSYMAHHQGMIIASLANVLKDNIINELFLSDSAMAGAKLLLSERKAITKTDRKPHEDYVYSRQYHCEDLEVNYIPTLQPKVNMLTNGKYSVCVNAYGGGVSMSGDVNITLQKDDIYASSGVSIKVKDLASGEIFSPYSHDLRDLENYKINAKYNAIQLLNIDKCIKETIFIPHCINGEVREIVLHNLTDNTKEYDLSIYADISLARNIDAISHPIFSDMFVSSEYDRDKNAVIYHRKSREKIGDDYCAVVFKGANGARITTNRYNARGRQNMPTSKKLPDFGDVLYPCFSLNMSMEIAKQSSATITIIILECPSKVELSAMIDSCQEEHFASYAAKSAEIQSLSRIAKLIPNNTAFKRAINLAGILTRCGYSESANARIRENNIYNLMASVGLNGELKTIYYKYEDNDDEVVEASGIVKYINICGIKVNLLIEYLEEDIYHKNIYNHIIDILGGYSRNIKLVMSQELSQDIRDICFINYTDIDKTVVNSLVDTDKYRLREIDGDLIEIPAIVIASGSGGFDENDDYIINKPTFLPYSNVIALKCGGILTTENGGGYYYTKNSRENKLTVWRNEPVEDAPSEKVIIGINGGEYYRINRLIPNGYVKVALGKTCYVGSIKNIEFQVDKYVIQEGNIAVTEVSLINNNDIDLDISLGVSQEFCLGATAKNQYLSIEKLGNIGHVMRSDTNNNGYFTFLGREIALEYNGNLRENYKDNYIAALGDSAQATVNISLASHTKNVFYYVLSPDYERLKELDIPRLNADKEESIAYFNNINKIKISSKNHENDLLINRYLMYPIVSSRLNGRLGYYQAGGAIGFRDQLQDCLAMLYTDSEYVKTHIINCAEHQFESGDVLHWWHEGNVGVRTRISDDKLFLPYCVAEYIYHSGDMDILKENARYLSGEKLAKGQESRYQKYDYGVNSGSIMEHCLRAIDSSLTFGEHGLILIGSGDWNDALNGIGLDGRGESVWLTMFCYEVISKFLEYMENESRIKYLKILDNMYAAINAQYVGGYFRRAFTDDGKWLGDSNSQVCKIDLISQAYAVISRACKRKDAVSAMKAAENALIDYDKRIIKLLSPPFNKDNYYGYISSYPEGVRENGGQYTHASIWFIRAVAMLGERERALELVDMINPIIKCQNSKINELYMGEPYVLSGDVYASGQMGWSWYTGASAWLYKTLIEDIIGIKIHGAEMIIDPQYLRQLGDNYTITLKWKTSIYNINFVLSNRRNISIDGICYGNSTKNAENNDKRLLKIPLIGNNRTFNVKVEY